MLTPRVPLQTPAADDETGSLEFGQGSGLPPHLNPNSPSHARSNPMWSAVNFGFWYVVDLFFGRSQLSERCNNYLRSVGANVLRADILEVCTFPDVFQDHHYKLCKSGLTIMSFIFPPMELREHIGIKVGTSVGAYLALLIHNVLALSGKTTLTVLTRADDDMGNHLHASAAACGRNLFSVPLKKLPFRWSPAYSGSSGAKEKYLANAGQVMAHIFFGLHPVARAHCLPSIMSYDYQLDLPDLVAR